MHNESVAIANLKKSAAQDNPDAIMLLAELSNNSEETFMYYSKAADLGNSLAQCIVASMYLKGIGTSVNHEEALKDFLLQQKTISLMLFVILAISITKVWGAAQYRTCT